MVLTRSQTRKHLASIQRLERELSQTTSPEPRPGYALNQWGAYEDEATRGKVLAKYRELIALAPDEAYFRYLFANALARARCFDDSVAVYAALVAADGQYSHTSQQMIAIVQYSAGNLAAAQQALNAYNHPFLAKGIEPRHRRIEDLIQ